MKLKKQIIILCLLGAFQMPFYNLFAQGIQTKPTRQSSFEAFSQGNYEKAYSEFRELLLTYTKDPLYKYYSGVCLVKLNKNPGEATNLLKEAVEGTGNLKTLPSDGLFYLGRAQQMSGKFSDAEESYKLYTDRVGKKTSKELGVPDLIQQCIQKKGQIADSEVKPPEINSNDKKEIIKPEVILATEVPVQKTIAKPTAPKENLPSAYEKVLGEGVEFQYKADSVSTIVNNQKKELDKLTGAEKSALYNKLIENEKVAASLQNQANQKYHEAQLIMNPQQETAIPPKAPQVQTGQKNLIDTVTQTKNPVTKMAYKKPDTTSVMPSSVKTQVETFSLFAVLPQPANNPKANIIMDPDVPAGLVYRIQIAVFRNPVTPAYFKGISPVYGFRVAGTDKTIYYAGAFRKSSDAGKALATVKAKGFKDSFIVPLLGNKSVSPDRAALLEKEWGNKSLVDLEKTVAENKADTIPPTLTFRVEVMKSVKPLKDDIFENIRKLSGNRGLEIVNLEDGKFDYLIGKFITFESAAEYSDLLKRNGYRDAQVVAWMGKKQIPIETARQLVDKLK